MQKDYKFSFLIDKMVMAAIHLLYLPFKNRTVYIKRYKKVFSFIINHSKTLKTIIGKRDLSGFQMFNVQNSLVFRSYLKLSSVGTFQIKMFTLCCGWNILISPLIPPDTKMFVFSPPRVMVDQANV
jgi:hypothetical protein